MPTALRKANQEVVEIADKDIDKTEQSNIMVNHCRTLPDPEKIRGGWQVLLFYLLARVFTLDYSRINNRWPLTKEAFPLVFAGCALASCFAWFGLGLATVLIGALSLFTAFFFRDPERHVSTDDKAVLTPADGRILEIRDLDDNDSPLGEPAVKISIFMSIFNVHVNRIPVGGIIERITYHPGKFISANLDKASEYNEKNTIILQTSDSRRIAFIQIAGAIARRISCWVDTGDHVCAGQRFGLIRFGSRLEVYLPLNSRITASPRQRVRAGETVIGYLP